MPVEQKQVDEFFYALAAAILAWQPVENTLFLCFNFFVGPHKNPNVLSAVYHSVINLQTRLAMIDSAAETIFKQHPELSDEWKKLSSRATKASKRRNRLVHFGLVQHTDSDGQVILSLQPSMYDVTAGPGLQYDIKQIREWHDSFNDLWRDLNVFLDRLPQTLRPSH